MGRLRLENAGAFSYAFNAVGGAEVTSEVG